jgi:hypothetical protein
MGAKPMSEDSAEKLNLLVAFPYLKADIIRLILANQQHIRFLLDSGAFTAWKAGKPIALDDYCRFIEGLPFKPWRYFTLDVIGDPAASLKNYELMLKRGFTPVPIFTRGEDPSVLEDYYKTSDVVGVGGLVGTQANKGFVNGIMRRIGKRKVHWLGFTDLNYVKIYKPYMCDSSSWEGGARYASVRLYLGRGRFATIKKADFLRKPSNEIVAALHRYGVEASTLGASASWHGGQSVSRALSAGSSIVMSLDVERNVGTKMFIAAAALDACTHLVDQFNSQQKRKAS